MVNFIKIEEIISLLSCNFNKQKLSQTSSNNLMSLNKRTYSPLTSTSSYNNYSYSSTLSPSYSYSRVSSYLDALQKDEAITKLRKELSDVRSLEMKYNSMMQQIHLAEKENQLLQIKNQQIQKQYLQKIKAVKDEVQSLKTNLNQAQKTIETQEQSTKEVEAQIQKLMEELKSIKAEQDQTAKDSQELEKQIQTFQKEVVSSKSTTQVFKEEKSQLQKMAKEIAQKMQAGSQKMRLINEYIQKQQQEVELLTKQLQNSQLQSNNLSIISQKNKALIENHLRKSTIQDGQIQQLKIELNELKEQLLKTQKFQQQKKDQLYKSIVTVQEKSCSTLQNLKDVEKLLTLDNTSKQYFLDLVSKLQKLKSSNQKLHDMQKHLLEQLHDVQIKEYKLLHQAKCNMENDIIVKRLLQNRLQSERTQQ